MMLLPWLLAHSPLWTWLQKMWIRQRRRHWGASRVLEAF